MKIAIAQVNTVIGDFKHNTARIRDFAETARARACDLIVFPELVIEGYPPRDLLEKHDFIEAGLSAFSGLVEDVRGIGVICGLVGKNQTERGNDLLNSAVLFEDGDVLFRADKRLLPTYDVFDETRYFEPGTRHETFAYKGATLGLTVCEDAWNDKDFWKRRRYPSDPVEILVQKGADLIINIAASPYHVRKREFRYEMLGAISRKYGVPLIHANQVGGNDSLLFDGVSAAFDRQGNAAARATDFEEDLIVFDTETQTGDMRPVAETDAASIYKALVMGTRDYVTKCGFSKAVVGLSGGIDSALTVAAAAEALGKENVSGVFMPSRYTSQDNYEDTEQLAAALGIRLTTVPIDDMFTSFVRYISPSFGEDDPGVTEQNIQARIRGTILMGMSNKYGCLLLSTGNKSELAVGYCTLYGDMNGGLAVISDVPKTVVYDIARHVNEKGEIIPQRIIDKAPSAELKPDQTDQDDLPPYDVLDAVLKAYVEEARSVDEIAAMGFDRAVVADIAARVDRNEYKRRQSAPGLRVTSKAFGEGRRFPLAQRYRPYGQGE